jgi:hypothetical protein
MCLIARCSARPQTTGLWAASEPSLVKLFAGYVAPDGVFLAWHLGCQGWVRSRRVSAPAMAPPTERCVFVSGGWTVLGAAAVRIDFAHDRGRVTLDLPADVSPARVRVRGQGVMDFVAIARRQRCWWHPGFSNGQGGCKARHHAGNRALTVGAHPYAS